MKMTHAFVFSSKTEEIFVLLCQNNAIFHFIRFENDTIENEHFH